jgi:hypothetical protein
MYFVTSKRPGYVLFAMTPSGRAAIGLAEDRRVHLFERLPGGAWSVLREWDAAALSHTEIMLALGDHEEPDDPKRLLDLLPGT